MRTLAKKAVNRSVLDLALERLNHAFDLFDHLVVSFSGGKDSTVVLNLAAAVARERGRLPLHVFFFDEEAIPFQVEEYMRRVAARPDIDLDWFCVPIKHRNGCSRRSPYWYPWAPEEEAKWVRPMPAEGLKRTPNYDGSVPEGRLNIPQITGAMFDPARYGTVGMVMGIRAQESITRYRAVARRTVENYIVKHQAGFSGDRVRPLGNVWKVYPIYDWSTEDVWTAPAGFGWDYCRAYDLMEMAGIPHPSQRLAPPFGEEPMRGLWMFKVCFPELWDRMHDRVPGAAAAARYAMTDLYAYGGLPEKPAGMTYEEYLRHLLDKWPSETRAKIARRIQEEIKLHFTKTGDPILHETHPETGLSWKFLLAIAARGDFKKRRQVRAQVDGANQERLRRVYAAALGEQRRGHAQG